MWVYEEMIEQEDGSQQKLTDIINSRHENVKYLPGIRLPANVKAVADLAEACQDATLLIFVLPHQFLPKLLPTIREYAHPACRGVSLIKGLGKSRILKLCRLFVALLSPVCLFDFSHMRGGLCSILSYLVYGSTLLRVLEKVQRRRCMFTTSGCAQILRCYWVPTVCLFFR